MRRLFSRDTGLRMCVVCAAASMRGRRKSTQKCRDTGWNKMRSELERKVAELLQNPKNMRELESADAVGTVGNAGCGEMLRMWIKFKEQNGKRVIDKATFQSFGCE